MKEYPVTCYCGSIARLKPNEVLYAGRSYGNGFAYICGNWPACSGSVGVHPTGKPLGTIANPETKALRSQVHSLIDPLWHHQQQAKKKRGSVYGYLRRILNLNAQDCHIGNFDADMCHKALIAIKNNPYVQP